MTVYRSLLSEYSAPRRSWNRSQPPV